MNIPPRTLSNRIRNLDAQPEPESADDASHVVVDLADESHSPLPAPVDYPSLPALPADENALPVLDAFRTFLEEERRQTRHRLRVLIGSFSTAFVLILVAAGIAGTVVFLRIKARLDAVEQSAKVLTPPAVVDQSYSSMAMSHLSNTTRRLETDILRERESLAQLRTALLAQLAGYSGKLESVEGRVKTIQGDNEDLRLEFGTIRELAEQATNVPPMAMAMTAPAAEPIGTPPASSYMAALPEDNTPLQDPALPDPGELVSYLTVPISVGDVPRLLRFPIGE